MYSIYVGISPHITKYDNIKRYHNNGITNINRRIFLKCDIIFLCVNNKSLIAILSVGKNICLFTPVIHKETNRVSCKL